MRFTTLLLVLIVCGTPFVYRSHQSIKYRNLRVVQDGRLYRSGQMSPSGFERAVRELGIQTVVSLRDTKLDDGVQADQNEEDYCQANGLNFFRLPPGDWSNRTGAVAGERPVRDFLAILDSPQVRYPVLVHCFAGIHRTGAQCAIYRIEHCDWNAKDAIAEMRSMGTPRTTFDDDLLNYLQNYPRGKLRAKAVGETDSHR
jgi:protein tyrosine/serine phosphatase